ncbi:hypothetical protein [Methanobacterium ferruginis]|uniref:hypothetical protein n=1 Tax=Methanobacterium ferruginis TaxID=710191 RepID=UPI0025724F42|nr:hypothetical protein [Methanobacterium ferruginis]BDZ66616.1 hypothetical protein GCM10025860_00640 [Methanobacterium ferruginis]
MEVTVIIGEDEKQLDVEEGKTIKNLLQMMEIPVETVVVKKTSLLSWKKRLSKMGILLKL